MHAFTSRKIWRSALAAACCLAAPLLASAQQAPDTEAAPAAPTASEIAARIETINASTTLAEDIKSRALDQYGRAQEALTRAEEWQSKLTQYESAISEAPALLQEIEKELANPPAPVEAPAADVSLVDLELQVTQAQSDLERMRAEFAELQAEPARRSERRRAIPELLSAARSRLQEIQTQLSAPAPADEPAEVAAARSAELQVRQRARQLEVSAYEKELQSYDVRGQLLTQRIARLSRRVTRQEQTVSVLTDTANARRQLDARSVEAETRRIVRDTSSFSPDAAAYIESFAAENAALNERRTGPEGLVAKLRAADDNLNSVSRRREEVSANLARIKERVAAAESSVVVGLLLRRQAEQLPNVRVHKRRAEQRQGEIARAQIEQIEIREEWLRYVDFDGVVNQTLAEMPATDADRTNAQLEPLVRDLVDARRKTLDAMLNDYDSYFAKLVDLDAHENQLIETTEEFTDFIAERVLFIRSGTFPTRASLRDGIDALAWFGNPGRWTELLRSLLSEFTRAPLQYVVGLAAFVFFLAIRGRTRRGLQEIGENAAKASCTDIVFTWRALLHTLVLSLPVLLGLGLTGIALTRPFSGNDFGRAVGSGLMVAAGYGFVLSFCANLLRPNGLVEAHFGRSAGPVGEARRRFIRTNVAILVCVFLSWTIESSGEEAWKESLGRGAFVALMIVAGLFAQSIFKGTPSIAARIAVRPRTPVRRRALFWSKLLSLSTPALLLIVALSGYYYTALRISVRVFLSLSLLAGVVVTVAFVLRWLELAHRKLAREQARQRRAALKSKEDSAPEGHQPLEAELLDLTVVDAQTQRLVRTVSICSLIVGLWFIWIDLVPALEVLNRFEIGSTTEVATEVVTEADGAEHVQSVERIVPITLGDLIVALLIALVTFAAARNIPGALEIAVLQRTALAAGERYAVKTIMRYILVAFGVALAFGAVGITWRSVQWLVAALGLGLGFGLQEIFANFMSGLILLFERPIRLGDTVTIGGIHGTVTRIRIRATTITDFDRKELIVPNKEFITGQLINWTLSDSTLRVVVPVGVSYSSDIRLVKETLLHIAESSEAVLEDPPPQVLFLGFGDSTLNFELRVFCSNFESFLPLRDEMHMAITDAFREKGIEIAFPQRDLHLRTVESHIPIVYPQAPGSSDAGSRDR